MPRRSGSFEQWGSHKSTLRGVPARRYAILISPYVQVPNVRVDAQTWDRILRGVPRDYVLPDETLLAEIVQQIKAGQRAEQKAEEE